MTPWHIRRLEACPSTNAEAMARVMAGEDEGLVVVTDHQTAGRGRLDRVWETPKGTALTFSAVLDPRLPSERWPLLPLVVGLAVVDGVRRVSGVELALKWPNDVLLDERKLAGILVERVPGTMLAVAGVGINVHQRELPVPTGISLALAGAHVHREDLLQEILVGLDTRVAQARQGPYLLEDYRAACSTLGQQVRVLLPRGEEYVGEAHDVDRYGRLLVGDRAFSSGDVVHVRPQGSAR